MAIKFSFADKVALVTGGGSGIGKAVALRFANAGARIVIADIHREAGESLVSEIALNGGSALFVQTDVSDARQVERLVSDTVSTFNGLDFACNAAGIDPERYPLLECPDEMFDRVIAINLRGAFLCLKHEISQMIKLGGGTIVNISSVTAMRSRGVDKAAYVSSKAGLLALSRNAAMRYARDGVRINAIMPGAVDTPMLRKSIEGMGVSIEELAGSYGAAERLASPVEIADSVLWLCSEESSYIVGHALPVDGGFLVR